MTKEVKEAKYPIGYKFTFIYCGQVSNHERRTGVVVGYTSGDRVLFNFEYDGVKYKDCSVHVNKILPE